MLYFDVNATAPPLAEADEAYREANVKHWHNPSSPYSPGARTHLQLDDARERLAGIIGCAPEAIVFNSGATEGNNSLFAWLARSQQDSRVAVSAIEHPCILEAARTWFPKSTTLLPVNRQGVVDLNALETALSNSNLALVSIMAANNETGALQPWQEAEKLCRSYGVLFHTDAAQWLGKLPAEQLAACDFVTGCAHKFGGPRGVGFIKVSSESNYTGQAGGGQESRRRSGTENYPGIAAMVTALEHRTQNLQKTHADWAKHRDAFEATLKKNIPGITVLSEDVARLANTSYLLMPYEKGSRWVAKLDKRGVYVSTGSACASGKTGASHVLTAMGLEPEIARRSIRISADWDATAEDWQKLAEIILETDADLQREANSGDSQVIRI